MIAESATGLPARLASIDSVGLEAVRDRLGLNPKTEVELPAVTLHLVGEVDRTTKRLAILVCVGRWRLQYAVGGNLKGVVRVSGIIEGKVYQRRIVVEVGEVQHTALNVVGLGPRDEGAEGKGVRHPVGARTASTR